MKDKEIIKHLRQVLDRPLQVKGYKFNSKKGSYIRFDSTTGLYFEISFLLLDYATEENVKGKYLEIYLYICHNEISKILCETSTRNFLDLFSFPLVRNMLPDIVLNPDFENYTKRNNHNYFRLIFSNENDLNEKPVQILSLIDTYVLPFFEKFDTLEKIGGQFDNSYEKNMVFINSNPDRLFALTALLWILKDSEVEKKTNQIRTIFEEYSNRYKDPNYLKEFDRLVERFKSAGGG